MMIIWWCQIEIKKRLYKKLKNMKVFGVKKILGDEKIRERKREKK